MGAGAPSPCCSIAPSPGCFISARIKPAFKGSCEASALPVITPELVWPLPLGNPALTGQEIPDIKKHRLGCGVGLGETRRWSLPAWNLLSPRFGH